MNYFRYVIYALVTLVVFSARGGSYEDFFSAIRNDNAGTLANLFERGFDPNTRDPKGQPGLTMAIQLQSAKAEKALLERRDIDINALNQTGESALMMAALR